MKNLIRYFIIPLLIVAMPIVALGADTRSVGVFSIKDKSGAEVATYSGSHALLIGVSDYRSGWPDLEGISDDIEKVEDALTKHGFHIEKVMDPDSTELKKAFEGFINSYGYDEDNRLLFYYSGHGYSRSKGRKGYLVPGDAPDPRKDKKGFLRKSLTMGDILNMCKKMEARHALFLFDSCFSGTIFKAKSLPEQPPHISTYTASPVRQFITAGSAGEEVPAKSIFTPLFVRALRGEADLNRDNYVTGTELGMYLHDEVMSYNGGQSPQYGKIKDPDLDEGDFVFALGRGIKGPVHIPPVPEDVEGFDLEDIEKRRQRRQEDERKLAELKAKWSRWQKRFDSAYDKALEYDKDKYVSTSEKVQVWKRLADSFSQDNPYSTEDQLIRSKAMDRVNYWNNYREPEPSVVDTHSYAGALTGMEMVFVKGGCYQMGDQFGDGYKNEKPVHEVCVNDFYIGKYEVTQGQWEEVMGDNPSKFKSGDNYPVEKVSWNDVQDFIRSLNRKTGKNYRLLTEAEWEYAARSGGKREKYAGTSSRSSISQYAWYSSNSDSKTHPVGRKEPNGLGIYDMSGNVYEWVQDIYSKKAYKKHQRNNPIYTGSGSYRVFRGGSWISKSRSVRASYRRGFNPDYRDGLLGLRLARTP